MPGIEATMADLERLLEDVHRGEIALPEFQRDFDWSATEVRELLVTVFSGWPAGSLLMMRGGSPFFELRQIEGADVGLANINSILLDGQQRLTSLYHALYNRGPNVYAVDFEAIGSDGELEEAVRSIPRHEWDVKYGRLEQQVQESIIPCSVLVTPTAFFEWRDAALATVPSNTQENLRKRLTTTYRDILSPIHRYRFPTVTLDETVKPEAMARIFERVNRTGQRLSTFDLMVAKVYEPHWNLRTKWDEVRQEKSMIEAFLSEDGMPLLQVIALRYERDIRQSGVLRLNRQAVHDNWSRVVQGTESALAFLVNNCGVTPGFVPYRSMIVLFAAVAVDYPHALEEHKDYLQRFFWSKCFAQGYDVAANTRIVADYSAIVSYLEGRREEASLPTVDPSELFYAARRTNRAVWAAFVCALTVADPSGLFADLTNGDGQRLDPAAARLTPLVPNGLKSDTRDSAPPHLRVLAMARTSRGVATQLRRKDLRLMLTQLLSEQNQIDVDRSLKAHFLPTSSDILQTSEDDWPNLLILRNAELQQWLENNFRIRFRYEEDVGR